MGQLCLGLGKGRIILETCKERDYEPCRETYYVFVVIERILDMCLWWN